jgi:hypothetical protein
MWIEINNKLITGIHENEPSQVSENSSIVFIEGAGYECAGKWYTKAKGIHDPVLTKTQSTEEQKAQEIVKAKRFLLETDYVVTKISEAMILDDNVLKEKLLTDYADVLQKRKEFRELVG